MAITHSRMAGIHRAADDYSILLRLTVGRTNAVHQTYRYILSESRQILEEIDER